MRISLAAGEITLWPPTTWCLVISGPIAVHAQHFLVSSGVLFIHSLVLPLFHQRSPNSSSSNKLITSKQAAALFRRDKFILLQFVFYGKPFSIYIFTREEPGTSCSRDFARATAGKLSSTITIFFGRLTR